MTSYYGHSIIVFGTISKLFAVEDIAFLIFLVDVVNILNAKAPCGGATQRTPQYRDVLRID